VKYASGLVVLSGIIAFTSNFLNPRAPISRGRTATEWIRSIDLSKDASATRVACEALRELGSASLPAVLHELQARDYPKYLKPINSLYNACGFWRVRSWNWGVPEIRREQGSIALQGIAPVIGAPALTNLMSHPSRNVRVTAALAVCGACKGDPNGVTALFVSAMRSPRPEMREAGLEGFSHWSVLTQEGTEEVYRCASDLNPEVRGTALRVLEYYRLPHPALPHPALRYIARDAQAAKGVTAKVPK